MIAGIVCEGPTDFPVLRAFVEALWPGVEQILPLQPEGDAITGAASGVTGWGGVKKWCEQHRRWLDDFVGAAVGAPLDLLVVHVDLDACRRVGVRPGRGERVAETAKRLCKTVHGWLGGTLPRAVVIAVPAQRAEAWCTAAVRSLTPAVERDANPERHLAGAWLLRRDGRTGKVLKDVRAYEEIALQVEKNLPRVRGTCSEADRFARKIEERARRRPSRPSAS